MPAPIIDFHVHMLTHDPPCYEAMDIMADKLSSKAEYDAYIKAYADPDFFVDMMKQNGLDYAVILAEYIPLCFGEISNETVAHFCARHQELIPFCSFNPYLHDNLGQRLQRLCEEYDFKGIKLYPSYNHFYANDKKLYSLYEKAQEMRLPVLLHTGSSVITNTKLKYGNPIYLDDVAVDFPDLSLVMAHGGRGPWYKEAMTLVRLHKNMYIDLTGLPVLKLLQFFPEMERFAHKFIFGTDWPQVVIKDSISKYHQLGMSQKAVDMILGGNAARLLNIGLND